MSSTDPTEQEQDSEDELRRKRARVAAMSGSGSSGPSGVDPGGSFNGGFQAGQNAVGAFQKLSDRESKTKIRDLENELQRTYAALGGGDQKRRTMADLDDAQREATDYLGEDDNQAFGTPLRQAPYPTPRAPDTAALDRSAGYRPVGSYGYDYKDSGAPGAAPGPQSGPMADELRGLPGVVKPGPDGMDRVDIGRLTLNNASALGQHERRFDQKADRSEVDDLRRQLAALGGSTSSGTDDERLRAALGR